MDPAAERRWMPVPSTPICQRARVFVPELGGRGPVQPIVQKDCLPGQRSNVMTFPVGDQLGFSSHSSSDLKPDVKTVRLLLPSASMIRSVMGAEGSVTWTNAMRRPSGDHDG